MEYRNRDAPGPSRRFCRAHLLCRGDAVGQYYRGRDAARQLFVDSLHEGNSRSSLRQDETGLDWSQRGPQGQPGQDGTNGTNGVSGWEIVQFTSNLPPEGDDYVGTAQGLTVSCPAGKKVLGGGVTTDEWVNSIIRSSGPNAAGTQWKVIIQRTNDGDSPNSGNTPVRVYAICANVT